MRVMVMHESGIGMFVCSYGADVFWSAPPLLHHKSQGHHEPVGPEETSVLNKNDISLQSLPACNNSPDTHHNQLLNPTSWHLHVRAAFVGWVQNDTYHLETHYKPELGGRGTVQGCRAVMGNHRYANSSRCFLWKCISNIANIALYSNGNVFDITKLLIHSAGTCEHVRIFHHFMCFFPLKLVSLV